MEQSEVGCSVLHNLKIVDNEIVVCPDIEDIETKEMIHAIVGELKREQGMKIMYLLCDKHAKNYYVKDILHPTTNVYGYQSDHLRATKV